MVLAFSKSDAWDVGDWVVISGVLCHETYQFGNEHVDFELPFSSRNQQKRQRDT